MVFNHFLAQLLRKISASLAPKSPHYVVYVFLSFAENSCLLRLTTMLMRVVRGNQTVADCKTKTVTKKKPKHSVALRATLE